jgi:hypothetical protein
VNLTLIRRPSKGGATIGELFLNGAHECFTLEDVTRESLAAKVYGETAIPPFIGEPPKKYRIAMTQSPRFKRVLPLLLDVPGFSGVRIHAGNKAEHTDGCILVGEEAYENTIGRSKEALLELMAAIDAAIDSGEQVWIEIKNADTTEPA